jgi:hypothetical protein
MNGINIGFAQSPALNSNESRFFQFTDEFGNTGSAHSHVFGQPLLPWKAGIIVPGVAQEHGVGHLGANGQIGVLENEIRDLGEAAPQHRIIGVELQVLLLDDFPYCLHVWYDYLTSGPAFQMWINSSLFAPAQKFHGSKQPRSR